jgi:hypothetical protein
MKERPIKGRVGFKVGFALAMIGDGGSGSELSIRRLVSSAMITLVSFTAVAIGTVVLGVAMSIASKKLTGAGALLIVVGLIGVTYGFVDGGRATMTNPPDIALPAVK